MNRKFQILSTALLFAVALVFTSCGGDEEDVIVISVDNLTEGTWSLTDVQVSEEALEPLVEAFSPSTFVFDSNNTYSSAITGFGEDEGTWAFSNNQLTLDGGTEFETIYEIRELSASRMIMFVEDEEDGVLVNITWTYGR